MKELSNKEKLDILRVISMPEMTSDELDNCPVTQEVRQLKKRVEEERRRDPEKVRARGLAFAKECGLEIIGKSHPRYEELLGKSHKRLAAKAAKESIPDAELFKKRPRI